MTVAFVFPGQGSQSLGMLSDFLGEPVIVDTLETASASLGYDMISLITDGPESQLNATEFTQPALLACSVALYRFWVEQGGCQPALMAGHSLGEYTALVCAGALSYESALSLVATRGRLMQAAVPAGEGAMAAIIGLDDERIAALCEEASQGDVVSPANFNAIGQTVIAGSAAAVARVVAAAESEARMVVKLPVSVPSHCALMRSAATQFETALASAAWEPARIPVIHNVDISISTTPAAIQTALTKQLYSPVRWVETVNALVSQGVTQMIECGPGKVLTGLNKRIARQIPIASLETRAAFDAALQSVVESV